MYLFEGDKRNRIIVGSSNLTKQGLFQNVEMAVQIDFTRPDEDGEALLKQTNDYLTRFFEGKIENVKPLTKELINQLYELKLIPDETGKREEREQRKDVRGKQDKAKMGALQKLFPTVELQKSPENFQAPPHKVSATPATPAPMLPPPPPPQTLPPTQPPTLPLDPWASKGSFLWSKTLTKSDAQQVGRGTNATGCLRLVQAGHHIDQTTEFRKRIFGKIAWRVGRTQPYEEFADVQCYVKILGRDTGIHRFMLRHKPSGEAGQNNYTTSISWGDFVDQITQTNLTGRVLYLYGPPAGQNEPFFIEVR